MQGENLMTYTIKEVAAKTGLSAYTLRFYDKKGLLPFVARDESGYRAFTDGDLNLLHTICCLKDTGMKIDDIRSYIEAVMAGPQTVDTRQALLTEHRQAVEDEIAKLQRNLEEVDYKLAMYSAPDATERVATEYNMAQMEKIALKLPNPYVKQ